MTDQVILVTGAAGFIGFRVARQLLAEGRSVVGLDNLNSYYDPAQAGVRYSIEYPQSYVHSNLQGFLNLLEGCRTCGCRHLVYASSSSVYDANTKLPFSVQDRTDHPVSFYAATKKRPTR